MWYIIIGFLVTICSVLFYFLANKTEKDKVANFLFVILVLTQLVGSILMWYGAYIVVDNYIDRKIEMLKK